MLTIVANWQDWEELRDYSSLPDGLFSRVAAPAQVPDAGEDCCFRYLAPAGLADDLESLEQADEDKREAFDEFVHSLLGTTAVHLVVVRPEGDKKTLAQVIDFHSQLQEALRRSAGDHRDKECRLVVVLVFCVDFDPRHEQELAQIRQQDGIRRVYLMGNRLESVSQGVLHARHVWPLSVGRLLLVLNTMALVRGFPDGGKRSYAWRTFTLEPKGQAGNTDDDQGPEALRAKLFRKGLRALFEAPPPSAGGIPTLREMELPLPVISAKPTTPDDSADWTCYDPESEWQAVSSAWRNAITGHGMACEQLSPGGESPATTDVWARILETPSALRAMTEVLSRRPEAPTFGASDLPMSLGGLEASQKEVKSLQSFIQTLVRHRSPGMAGWTLVTAVVVLFVVVFTASGIRLLSADTLLPSLVAVVSAFVGSLCACILVISLENRAGDKVVEHSRHQISRWSQAWEYVGRSLSRHRKMAGEYQSFIRRLGFYWQIDTLGKRLREVMELSLIHI